VQYRDRHHAGTALAAALLDAGIERNDPDTIVLGVPRGGVTVAVPVAAELGAPLDVIVARKVGAPGNPEFAIGAVAEDGTSVIDESIVRRLGIPSDYVTRTAGREAEEVERRAGYFRSDKAPRPIAGKTCIVVDDGVATGATLEVVLRLTRAREAGRVVAAVPVGPPDTIGRLGGVADLVVCPLQPASFSAVGFWYHDFRQVEDGEVRDALEGYAAGESR
jgi:predicted phosphoribosyltransferase